ncbi:expressed protein [Phakopsora pachyrhizi]|uniref:Expressed protein n=1 Tax=Phakopsora pachyrhizi TaxID=170000 RepID=A0AAV0BEL3_PHAPC|nr:expressed protein [Phakopsora pachyrhizi]CAH7685241.1 expressed protein [Phakopsora pachyrhizi]
MIIYACDLTAESTYEKLMGTMNDRVGTVNSSLTALLSSIDPSTSTSSAECDLLMDEASIADPSSQIMGGSGTCRRVKGDDAQMTPNGPKALRKLSPRLGPNPAIPEDFRAQIMIILRELRDHIQSHFIKQVMDLAESYERLAFDLKAALKEFDYKLFISSGKKPFDSVYSLNELQEPVQDKRAQETQILPYNSS